MSKFLLTLPSNLRDEIKRESRKNDLTMNEFIVTIIETYITIQKEKRNGNHT